MHHHTQRICLISLGELDISWSPYSYSHNNPILLNDPLGLFSDTSKIQPSPTPGFTPQNPKILETVTVRSSRNKHAVVNIPSGGILGSEISFSFDYKKEVIHTPNVGNRINTIVDNEGKSLSFEILGVKFLGWDLSKIESKVIQKNELGEVVIQIKFKLKLGISKLGSDTRYTTFITFGDNFIGKYAKVATYEEVDGVLEEVDTREVTPIVTQQIPQEIKSIIK